MPSKGWDWHYQTDKVLGALRYWLDTPTIKSLPALVRDFGTNCGPLDKRIAAFEEQEINPQKVAQKGDRTAMGYSYGMTQNDEDEDKQRNALEWWHRNPTASLGDVARDFSIEIGILKKSKEVDEEVTADENIAVKPN